tara:strand:- start:417 stop:1727 length:1311 start_codon:yes stop_codon:yes gene_type:complete
LNKYNFFLFKNKLFSDNLINDSFWAILGSLIYKGLAFISGLIIINYLGKTDFGKFSIIKATIVAISTFFALGFNYVSTKFIAQSISKNTEDVYDICRFTGLISMFLAIFSMIIVFIFGNDIFYSLTEIDDNQLSKSLFSPFVFIFIICNWTIGVLSGLGAYKVQAFNNIITGILSFFITLIFTYIYGYDGAFLALFFTYLINLVLNLLILKKELKPFKNNSAIKKNLRKSILKFSIPLSLQEMIYPIFIWGVNYSILINSSHSALGLFSAALQWNAIVIVIPSMLKNVILSNLSSKLDDKHQTKIIVAKSTKINLFVSLLISIIILMLINFDFFDLIYTTSYSGLDNLIFLAIISGLILCVSDVYLQFLISKSQNWLVLLLKFLRDSIKIILIFIVVGSSLASNEIQFVSNVLVIILVTNLLFLIAIYFVYLKILS